MRKNILLAALLLLPPFFAAGCAMSDALFMALGDYYSAGGETRAEKKYHFDRQVEAARNYESWGGP